MKSLIASAAIAAVAAGSMFGTSAQAQEDKKIARTWKAKCGSCHGPDGKGETEKGRKQKVNDMSTGEWQSSRKDEDLRKAVLEGVSKEKDGVKQEMDGYKDELNAEQVDALIAFMRAFKK